VGEKVGVLEGEGELYRGRNQLVENTVSSPGKRQHQYKDESE
jgi:hypothetical protein